MSMQLGPLGDPDYRHIIIPEIGPLFSSTHKTHTPTHKTKTCKCHFSINFDGHELVWFSIALRWRSLEIYTENIESGKVSSFCQKLFSNN
jgi:hypothetical protein